MKLHTIKVYDGLVKSLLFGKAVFRHDLYLTATGVPSIGCNFNLQNDFQLGLVLETLQFDPYGEKLTGEAFKAEQFYIGQLRNTFKQSETTEITSLKAIVNNILTIRCQDHRYQDYPRFQRATEFTIPDRNKMTVISYTILDQYEKIVDDWITGFELKILRNNSHLLSRNSMERAVLVSLAADNLIGNDVHGNPMNLPLADALIQDNRADAWYQVRYGTFSDMANANPAVVKRRLYESEIFGLYDDGIESYNISRDDCKPLYNMYNLHKDTILHFERHYSYLFKEINDELALNNSTQQVKTLEQSFSIAYNRIRSATYIDSPALRLIDSIENDMQDFIAAWSQHDFDVEIAMAS